VAALGHGGLGGAGCRQSVGDVEHGSGSPQLAAQSDEALIVQPLRDTAQSRAAAISASLCDLRRQVERMLLYLVELRRREP
jgi:DNA-binding TFAR19-related protein (PDSD5 family)